MRVRVPPPAPLGKRTRMSCVTTRTEPRAKPASPLSGHRKRCPWGHAGSSPAPRHLSESGRECHASQPGRSRGRSPWGMRVRVPPPAPLGERTRMSCVTTRTEPRAKPASPLSGHRKRCPWGHAGSSPAPRTSRRADANVMRHNPDGAAGEARVSSKRASQAMPLGACGFESRPPAPLGERTRMSCVTTRTEPRAKPASPLSGHRKRCPWGMRVRVPPPAPSGDQVSESGWSWARAEVYPARESLFGGRHHRYLLPVRLLGAASRRERAHLPARRGAEAAGYRACLRCRPYRWPQSVSCTAPELVCRAVRLILAGALDRRSEAELGSRLGVSPRHLRRLFNAHLGLTPVGLARSARVHFARRLLDDTDLTITEVA